MADIILPWNSEYDDYLRDESRCTGAASSIAFPKTEVDVISIVREMASLGRPITIQGARTGIVAGAVPRGGHILNMSRMNVIGEVNKPECRITVQPGALLSDIRRVVDSADLFFPPDPTETSASIGGMVSSNASGAKSFFYGPTRSWITAIRVVLADGSVIKIRRGENRANGREFRLVTNEARVIVGRLPDYALPSVKSSAGYYTAKDMDMIDLFIGMEGTLGIITEIELSLIHKPKAFIALNTFFSSEKAALDFVRILRREAVFGKEEISILPVAIEFFNSGSLDLLRRMKTDYPAFSKIPELKTSFNTAIYSEFHSDSEETLEQVTEQLLEVMAGLGAGDDDVWCATNDRELEPLKAFRHAIPEAVNLLIGERKKIYPELTKLGTDMSVPDSSLADTLQMYNSDLKVNNLESVIFGHIGNNHLHVNILPSDMEEYKKGKDLYLSWAKRIVEMDGSVSAEHGIGKIKVPFLELMYGARGISEMRDLKSLFDPQNLLNTGNLF